MHFSPQIQFIQSKQLYKKSLAPKTGQGIISLNTLYHIDL